ncbi:hypothetical protein BaRGS_00034201, partial [Batillaria attramentaria]
TGETPVGQGAARENDEAINHTQALYSDAAPRATVTPASLAILADSAAVKLMFLMQQQLAESTSTISSLRIELSEVKKELSGYKAECATLRKEQEKMASLISDNEVKAKNQMKASEKCLVDTLQATATTLTKDYISLNEKMNHLVAHKTSQETKMKDMKKHLDTLIKSESEISDNTEVTRSQPTFISKETLKHKVLPTHTSPRTDTAIPNSPLQDSDPELLKIPVSNKFSVLSLIEDEDMCSPEAKVNNNKQAENQRESSKVIGKYDNQQQDKKEESHQKNGQRKAEAESQHTKKQSSPLDRLRAIKIRPHINSLIIGDSVTQYLDERRMSVDGETVQNISVSGLRVENVITWLSALSPLPNIDRVTVHIGINSCWNGPIRKQAWLNLFRLIKSVFPAAVLQMSSIVPPAGKHVLSRAAFTSNQSLIAACQHEHITFIDNVPTFVTASGAPKQILYHDKLHPSDRGVRSLAWNIKYGGRPCQSFDADRQKRDQSRDNSLGHHEQPGALFQRSRPHSDQQQITGPSPFFRPTTTTNDLMRQHLSNQPPPLHASGSQPPPLHASGHVPLCPDRGQAGPPPVSDLEYPILRPSHLHVPVNHPAPSSPNRRWERRESPDSLPGPAQAMRMIAQIMKPFLME